MIARDNPPLVLPVELVTVGIARYPHLDTVEALPAVECCTTVAELFTSFGVITEDWSEASSTEDAKSAIETRLGEWSQRRGVGSILYWVGHGEQAENGYHAVLGNAKGLILPEHVLSDDGFVDYLRRKSVKDYAHPEDWVLLVLDTCASGLGAWQIYSKLAARGGMPPNNVGIVGTSNGSAAAGAGAFPTLLKAKLRGFTPSDDYISVRELMRRLEDAFPGLDDRPRIYGHFTPEARIPHPAGGTRIQSPQDAYVELERVLRSAPSHIRNHFYAKAQGTEAGEIDWQFSGRRSEREKIVSWLKHVESGMFIVTGPAGSGKSAVLGMVLAASHPELVQALIELGGQPILDFLCPDPDTFTAATHLSGRTVAEATLHLAGQLGSQPTADPEELLATLDTGRNITILVDALDEARDPFPIAGLLRRLAALENVKILVGTRQSFHEDPDHPLSPNRVLLDALGAFPNSSTQVLHLDRIAGDIADYVQERLQKNLPPDLPNRNFIINRLTNAITAVDQPFLFARLAAYEASVDRSWQDPATNLTALLSQGHIGIFDRAIARIKARSPHVEALLHSLAYAHGNGYPRTGGTWAIAATALMDDPVTDDHIDQALKTAAPYIMLDSEFGVSTYRLAHRTYADRYLQLDEEIYRSPDADGGSVR